MDNTPAGNRITTMLVAESFSVKTMRAPFYSRFTRTICSILFLRELVYDNHDTRLAVLLRVYSISHSLNKMGASRGGPAAR
jgi:hypothetical protein